MHSDSTEAYTAAAEMTAYWNTASYSHVNNVADLVLESYGNGYAWFRPSTDAAESDDALYTHHTIRTRPDRSLARDGMARP